MYICPKCHREIPEEDHPNVHQPWCPLANLARKTETGAFVSSLTSQQQLQKLALYATAKTRLANPEQTIEMGLNPHKIRTIAKRLRKELADSGVGSEVFDLSGEDLGRVIFETLAKQELRGGD